jgi:multidrug efflux pump subunit AcrA (membrane-fusion protein)
MAKTKGKVNEMKLIKVLVAIMLSGLLVFLSLSCSSGSSSTTSTIKTQVVTVQKGTITVSVTGTGNLALENKQSLSFGQTGLVTNATNVKISEVLVKPGDIVDKGTVLVKADTKDWQDQLTTDQHNLDSAKTNLDSAKAAVDKANSDVDSAKAGVTQAEANLQKAQYNLSQQQDIKDIQNKIDDAKVQLAQAKLMLQQATKQSDTGSMNYWQQMISYYSISPLYKDKNGNPLTDGGLLGQLEKEMADLLADPAHSGAASSVADIVAVQYAVKQAEDSLVNAKNSVTTSQNGITTAKNNVTLAQNKVDDAQSTLFNDKNSAQEIVAPFKGLITRVVDSSGNDLKTGAIVSRSTSLIEIADPEKFVANILVTEKDVMTIKMGAEATVSFDALSGMNYPAKITQIAPLSTTSQGVVNYKVTVELTSLTPITNANAAAQKPAQGTTGSTPPTNLPSGGVLPTSLPIGISTPTTGSPSTATQQSVSLKDGLSATVTIVVQQKDDILLIPNKAIKSSTVQIVNGTVTEARAIKTGITDSTNTEVVSGLNQGDKVQYTATMSSSSSSNTGGMGGAPPLGGMIP